jgi:CheY-like chemotaxis protein
MLRDMGHSVSEAGSGAEALDQLNASAVDLLITDYAMPRQSGTELIRLARHDRPALPALLITGYADADAIGERPADVGVLMKPFIVQDLTRAIQTAVGRVPAADDAN